MHVGDTPVPTVGLISWLSSVLPVLAGLKRWKTLTREMRILFGLLAFYLPFLGVELWTTFHSIKNLVMGDVYSLIEFVVFALVFSRWTTDEVARKAMRSSIGVVVILWVIAKFSFEPLGGNSNYLSPVDELLLILMALYTMFTLLRGNMERLFSQPQFWVSVGVIIYGAGTLPLFILSTKLLLLSLQEYEKVWNINWILQFVANVIYVQAFLCRTDTHVHSRYNFHSENQK